MKKVITVSALLTLIGLLIVQPALAGRFGNRQANQKKRIYQGVVSGELTPGETRQLVRQQNHIHKQKRRAWADGTLTTSERIRLERMQDKAGRNIYRLKHNNRFRNS